MSDTTIPPAKTEAEISAAKQTEIETARKAAKAKADAELKATIDRYTALEKKNFVKTDGSDKHVVNVVKYIGVHTVSGGVRAHLLEVVIKGIRSWTPVASKFLEEYTEVQITPETATSKII